MNSTPRLRTTVLAALLLGPVSAAAQEDAGQPWAVFMLGSGAS